MDTEKPVDYSSLTIEVYKELDSYDQEMIWSIMQMVKKTGEKRKRKREAEESGENVKYRNL